MVAVPPEPSDGHTVTDCEVVDACADLGDRAGDLVPGRHWKRHPGEGAVDDRAVGAADAAGGDVDARRDRAR